MLANVVLNVNSVILALLELITTIETTSEALTDVRTIEKAVKSVDRILLR